jgi:DNA-binding IclR family transcriptional regulator
MTHYPADARRAGNADVRVNALPQSRSPGIGKAVRILDFLADSRRSCSLTEIAVALGMAKSSTLALCTAMVDEDLVIRTPDGYKLGSRPVRYAKVYLDTQSPVADLHEIAEQFTVFSRETLILGVLADAEVLYIATRPGVDSIVNYRIGMRMPAQCSAVGKALLAHLPPSDVRAIFANRKFEARTKNSITSLRALEADLAAVRERGYAIDDEELAAGMICFATVINGPGDQTAAVGVSCVKASLDELAMSTHAMAIMNVARAMSGGRASSSAGQTSESH